MFRISFESRGPLAICMDSIDQPLRGGITKQLRHDPEDSDLETPIPMTPIPNFLTATTIELPDCVTLL